MSLVALALWLSVAAAQSPPYEPAIPRVAPMPHDSDNVSPLQQVQYELESRAQPVQLPPAQKGIPEVLPVPAPQAVPPAIPPVCLPGMPAAPLGDEPGVGITPRPSPQLQKEYDLYLERTVDPENVLDLVIDIPKLLIFKTAPKRVQVSDGRVLVVDTITERELSLLGKEVGKTVLNLWFDDVKEPKKQRILSYLVRVNPDLETLRRQQQQEQQARQQEEAQRQLHFKRLEKQINCAFPNSHVILELVGHSLLVRGQAYDSIEAVNIMQMIGPGLGQLQVGEQAVVTTIFTERGLDFDETVIIQPPGVEPLEPPAAAPPERLPVDVTDKARPLRRMPINVINMLKIPGEQQVMLKVVVAEVNRAAARSVGLNFAISNREGQVVFAQRSGDLLGGVAQSALALGGNLPALLDNGRIALAINALKTMNLARSLAEPNLTTLNGKPANFQAGGQFPIPVVTGFTAAGLQGVDFVPFGVQLSFIPIVLDKDRIRLQVTADVSTRDLLTGAVVSGTNVPGLNTRNFQTTVDLRAGQTLAVAGLIQNDFGFDSARVPFFGDIPILGRLAKVDNTSASEQELVILVTPQLVHPLNPNEKGRLPGSDIFEPGDVEFYLLGRLESRRPADYRSPVMHDIHRMLRYRHCESLFIIGPHGHSDGKH